MTIAALELNDYSLLIQAEDGSLHAEPGFARLTDDGVVTGEEARAVAWSEPQHGYNQYWCQLNQAPLPVRHRFARNHADIAFAQLQKLWKTAGSPESMILLVPGSFSQDQLSLILGMVEALPSAAVAVLDNALVANADVGEDYVYVDLQMHEAVLTVCRWESGAITITGQEIFPGIGISQIHNSLARHISNLMIDSYRFDPLHSSVTEQAIFDQIPHWLTRLAWEKDVSITLPSSHGEHPCILNQDAIKSLIGQRFSSLRSFLEKWPNCRPLLSPTSGLLSGLVDEFAGAEAMEPTASTQRCLSHHEEILTQVGDLVRMSSLQRNQDAADPVINGEVLATHLLCGDLALPLHRPVSVCLTESGPHMKNEFNDSAALTLVLRNGELESLHQSDEVAMPAIPRPGSVVRIGNHELKLIRVDGS